MFSYEDQQQEYYENEDAARALIDEIIEFNRRYKRKPKKFRKIPSMHEPEAIDFSEQGEGPFTPFNKQEEEADDDSNEIRPLMKVEVDIA